MHGELLVVVGFWVLTLGIRRSFEFGFKRFQFFFVLSFLGRVALNAAFGQGAQLRVYAMAPLQRAKRALLSLRMYLTVVIRILTIAHRATAFCCPLTGMLVAG
jgi:hypothetical protein